MVLKLPRAASSYFITRDTGKAPATSGCVKFPIETNKRTARNGLFANVRDTYCALFDLWFAGWTSENVNTKFIETVSQLAGERL